jgi:hypothetical protein
MNALAHVIVWLNAVADALGRILLAPLAVLPGWLGATLVSAVTGVLLLVAFKYTSNQRAIKRAGDDRKANLLALKLFKDSPSVSVRAQWGVLRSAARSLVLAIVPMLIMAVPVVLIMAQLAQWYEDRPVRVNEDAVVTLKLGGDPKAAWPDVRLQEPAEVDDTSGPVRVESERAVCWNVKPVKAGYHRLVFWVGPEAAEKELAAGDGYMRVSPQRPGWDWSDALLYPAERPFGPDSLIRSIEVDYPERPIWAKPLPLIQVPWWMVYWFIVSLVAALLFRPWLNVSI